MLGSEEKADGFDEKDFWESYLKVISDMAELPHDLYIWAIAEAKGVEHTDSHGLAYWSAWFASRKVAWVLLNKMRGRMGEEMTPEMIEEFRSLCATLAYD